MTNYALIDATGILFAFLLFPTLVFFPGYLAGRLSNVWQFRQRTFTFQVAASLPLSLSVGPILTFLLGQIASWQFVTVVYLCIAAVALVLLIRSRPKWHRTLRRAIFVGTIWSFFAGAWLMDWQWNSKLYFPVYALDYSTRAAFVHSLAAFGLPARTPLFSSGHAVALHYHYLWLLQCALIHAAAPLLIPARLALIAGTIWCGLGFMCLSALTMRLLFQVQSWKVIALLAVTGLDIIPALLILWGNQLHLLGTLPPSVEWWNQQVDGWLYTALWQPHYLCALIACLTGLLILWPLQRLGSAPWAALCFATGLGSGSFVALVFGVFVVAWMMLHPRESKSLLIAGVLAMVLLLPYLISLRGPAQNAGGPSLLAFSIRGFSPVLLSPWANLAALPLNYFLEFGFFGACLFVGYRRKLNTIESTLLLMIVVSVALCTFIKSGATPNNDFGWRGMLVAQFALLILAAGWLERNRTNALLKLLLILGVSGTVYDLLLTRFFPILSDANLIPKLKWLAADQKLGQRTRANREAYNWLLHYSKSTAILEQNPNADAVDIDSGLYGDRNIVAGDRTCTVGFGGSPAECKPIFDLAAKTFAGQISFHQSCSALAPDFLIVKDGDPIFETSHAWAFANQYVRIFKCDGSNRTHEP